MSNTWPMTHIVGMYAAACRVDEFIFEIVNGCQLRTSA